MVRGHNPHGKEQECNDPLIKASGNKNGSLLQDRSNRRRHAFGINDSGRSNGTWEVNGRLSDRWKQPRAQRSGNKIVGEGYSHRSMVDKVGQVEHRQMDAHSTTERAQVDEETRSATHLLVDPSTDGASIFPPLFESDEQSPRPCTPVLRLRRGYSRAHNIRVPSIDRAPWGYPRWYRRTRSNSWGRKRSALLPPRSTKQGRGPRSARASYNCMVEGQAGLRQHGKSHSVPKGGRRAGDWETRSEETATRSAGSESRIVNRERQNGHRNWRVQSPGRETRRHNRFNMQRDQATSQTASNCNNTRPLGSTPLVTLSMF